MKLEQAIKDTKILEEQELGNVCLVKKLDVETGELNPSHIIFSKWFKETPVTLKAFIRPDGYYDINYKDEILLKKVKIEDVSKKLDKFKASVHLSYGGSIDKITFTKIQKRGK